MPLPRVSLRSFLSSAKSSLIQAVQHRSPVTFVIGNESADLDSLCSAVVLAYLRTYSPLSKSNTIYVPLSNLPRSDLCLRPELAPALSRADLKPSDLITLSDLTLSAHHIAVEQTRWILVDHNALQGELGRIYGSRVVGCIDHHEEENKVPLDCGEEPRIVMPSGSCASLVIEYCRPAWDELGKQLGEEARQWNSELARLAIAPVLVDTANLNAPEITKVSDKRAVRYLEGWIMAGEGGEEYSTKEYFKEISNAKENIGGLSLRDILRKDYKQWGDLGISSVVKDMKFLIEKAGSEQKLLEAVKAFAAERKLSLFSLMTLSHPGGNLKRELLVWGLDEKGAEAAKKFAADSEEKLGFTVWKDESSDVKEKEKGETEGDAEVITKMDMEEEHQWRRCWQQNNTQHSRKQVAPLLKVALSS